MQDTAVKGFKKWFYLKLLVSYYSSCACAWGKQACRAADMLQWLLKYVLYTCALWSVVHQSVHHTSHPRTSLCTNRSWRKDSYHLPDPHYRLWLESEGSNPVTAPISPRQQTSVFLALRPDDYLSSTAACPHILISVYCHFLHVQLLMTPALPVLYSDSP